MHVAVVMPIAEQRGGAEVLLQVLMRYGQGRGVAWRVIFLEDGPMVADFAALGIPTHVVPAGRLREPQRYAACVWRIAALLRRERVDVVFSWMGKGHLFGGPAARLARRPALWYQHGIPPPRAVMDRLQTRVPARGIVACSAAAAHAQQQLRPRRDVRVVHPCVDLARFDPVAMPAPDAARAQLGLRAHGPLIGLVGRLQRWKGVHVLIDAMPAVLAAHPDAHCVVVGGRHALEPDYAEALETQVAALGLAERVTLAGYQPNVPTWMQAMDVVVHASDHEPFGMVVIEAMALGKAVVAGASGGPLEVITEGVDGLLAPYGDAGRLAHQLNRYLGDPGFRERVGRAARQRALAFGAEGYAGRFVEALTALAGAPARQPAPNMR